MHDTCDISSIKPNICTQNRTDVRILNALLNALRNGASETRFLSEFQTRGSIRVPSRAFFISLSIPWKHWGWEVFLWKNVGSLVPSRAIFDSLKCSVYAALRYGGLLPWVPIGSPWVRRGKYWINLFPLLHLSYSSYRKIRKPCNKVVAEII